MISIDVVSNSSVLQGDMFYPGNFLQNAYNGNIVMVTKGNTSLNYFSGVIIVDADWAAKPPAARAIAHTMTGYSDNAFEKHRYKQFHGTITIASHI